MCESLWLYGVPACLLQLQAAHVPPVSTSCIRTRSSDSDSTKNFTFWKGLNSCRNVIFCRVTLQIHVVINKCISCCDPGAIFDWCPLEAGQKRQKYPTQYGTLLHFFCCWSQLLDDTDWSPPGILWPGKQTINKTLYMMTKIRMQARKRRFPTVIIRVNYIWNSKWQDNTIFYNHKSISIKFIDLSWHIKRLEIPFC